MRELLLLLLSFVGCSWTGDSCGSNGSSNTAEVKQVLGPNAEARRVPAGQWGGDHIGLKVVDSGATLDHDCAHGNIGEPMLLDDSDRFKVKGTFSQESGGPITPGQKGDRSAVYEGRLAGNKMTLTITLTDTNEVVDTFVLVHGQSPRITKCL